MEIFGIGPLELVLIFLIMLVVLGPKEMINGARKSAGWIRKLRESDLFKTSKEIAEMPKQIMKDTGLQDEINQIRDMSSRTVDDAIRQTLYTPIDEGEHLPSKIEREKSLLKAKKSKTKKRKHPNSEDKP
jgi:Sec-independent protein translocase protein TatA